MSRSSRKRRRRSRSPGYRQPGADPGGQPADPAPARATRRTKPDDRPFDDRAPAAPWGSFPLVELVVLVALAMLVAGLFLVEGSRRELLIGTGLVLGSLAGLELAIREHLAGYRSHTLILAAVPAAIALGLLFFLGPDGLSPLLRVAAAAIVFGLAAVGLIALFRRRSGGLSLRVRGFRG